MLGMGPDVDDTVELAEEADIVADENRSALRTRFSHGLIGPNVRSPDLGTSGI